MTQIAFHAAGLKLAERRRRMRRLARLARAVALLGLMVIAAVTIAVFLQPTLLVSLVQQSLPDVIGQPGEAALRLASLIMLIPAAIYAAALLTTHRLFGFFLAEPSINPTLPGLLRRLGQLAIAAAPAGILSQTASIGVLTAANPTTRPQLAVAISGTEIASVIFGFLLFALSLVVQEALVLKEENEGFL